jgi:hypothetical protein
MICPRIVPSPHPTAPYSTSPSSSQSVSASPKPEPLHSCIPAMVTDPKVNSKRVQKELTEAPNRLDEANQDMAGLRTVLQAIQGRGIIV